MKRSGCSGLLVTWIVTAASAGVTAWLLPGVQLADARAAFVLAVVLGLLNTLVRPLLVLLTLPVTVLTLGLFLLVLNAGMVMAAAELVKGFSVSGFWSALLFSLVMSVVSAVLNAVVGGDDQKRD